MLLSIFFFILAGLAEIGGAVSYTHLDVYKRQVLYPKKEQKASQNIYYTKIFTTVVIIHYVRYYITKHHQKFLRRS